MFFLFLLYLSLFNELGDLLVQENVRLACSVYLHGDVPEKTILCFLNMGHWNKVMDYAKSKKFTPNYPMLLGKLLVAKRDDAKPFALMLASNGIMAPNDIVQIFYQGQAAEQAIGFLLEYLQSRGERDEDAALHTKLLELALSGPPRIADTIFYSPDFNFTKYDNLQVARMSESSGSFMRALQHCEDLDGIKRILQMATSTNTVDPEFLVTFFGDLILEDVLNCLEDLLQYQQVQGNLQLVCEVVKRYSEQLGSHSLVALFERHESFHGLYMYLGSFVNFTTEISEVELVCRENEHYNPEQTGNYRLECGMFIDRKSLYILEKLNKMPVSVHNFKSIQLTIETTDAEGFTFVGPKLKILAGVIKSYDANEAVGEITATKGQVFKFERASTLARVEKGDHVNFKFNASRRMAHTLTLKEPFDSLLKQEEDDEIENIPVASTAEEEQKQPRRRSTRRRRKKTHPNMITIFDDDANSFMNNIFPKKEESTVQQSSSTYRNNPSSNASSPINAAAVPLAKNTDTFFSNAEDFILNEMNPPLSTSHTDCLDLCSPQVSPMKLNFSANIPDHAHNTLLNSSFSQHSAATEDLGNFVQQLKFENDDRVGHNNNHLGLSSLPSLESENWKDYLNKDNVFFNSLGDPFHDNKNKLESSNASNKLETSPHLRHHQILSDSMLTRYDSDTNGTDFDSIIGELDTNVLNLSMVSNPSRTNRCSSTKRDMNGQRSSFSTQQVMELKQRPIAWTKMATV